MNDYRKKPVVIQAWQAMESELEALWYSEDGDHPEWLQDAIDEGVVYLMDGETHIKTLEGDHHVSEGDWIIRGVKGELYPCKPDIFEATYEAV